MTLVDLYFCITRCISLTIVSIDSILFGSYSDLRFSSKSWRRELNLSSLNFYPAIRDATDEADWWISWSHLDWIILSLIFNYSWALVSIFSSILFTLNSTWSSLLVKREKSVFKCIGENNVYLSEHGESPEILCLGGGVVLRNPILTLLSDNLALSLK